MLRPRQGGAPKSGTTKDEPKCQKCLKTGHWTFDCKNERASYISRPTRTALLSNPTLRLPEEDLAVRDLISKSSLTSDGAVESKIDEDDEDDDSSEESSESSDEDNSSSGETSSDESSIDGGVVEDDGHPNSSSTISDQLSIIDSDSDSSGFYSESSESELESKRPKIENKRKEEEER